MIFHYLVVKSTCIYITSLNGFVMGKDISLFAFIIPVVLLKHVDVYIYITVIIAQDGQ